MHMFLSLFFCHFSLLRRRIWCFSSVQSLSHVRPFATSWTAAWQASLSINNSWSLLKLMSIELLMPSNHLILCRPLLLLPSFLPSFRVFSSEFFTSGDQRIRVSVSASVLPMNIQDWFPLKCIRLPSEIWSWNSNLSLILKFGLNYN